MITPLKWWEIPSRKIWQFEDDANYLSEANTAFMNKSTNPILGEEKILQGFLKDELRYDSPRCLTLGSGWTLNDNGHLVKTSGNQNTAVINSNSLNANLPAGYYLVRLNVVASAGTLQARMGTIAYDNLTSETATEIFGSSKSQWIVCQYNSGSILSIKPSSDFAGIITDISIKPIYNAI